MAGSRLVDDEGNQILRHYPIHIPIPLRPSRAEDLAYPDRPLAYYETRQENSPQDQWKQILTGQEP